MQLLVEQARHPVDLLRGDGRLSGRHLLLEVDDLPRGLVPLELEGDQPFPHLRVLGFHHALLDEFEELGDTGLRIGVGVAKPGDLLLVLVAAFGCRTHVSLEHLGEPIGLQDAAGDLSDDNVVQLVHGHAQPRTGDRTFLQLLGATVIAVLTAFTRVLDQRGPAIPAACDARQQRRAVCDAGRRPARRSALQQPLDCVERLLRHDRGHAHGDPLRRRA
ncbi:MAG: hypothetical protein V9G24_20345 [Rhodoblastus sp.]